MSFIHVVLYNSGRFKSLNKISSFFCLYTCSSRRDPSMLDIRFFLPGASCSPFQLHHTGSFQLFLRAMTPLVMKEQLLLRHLSGLAFCFEGMLIITGISDMEQRRSLDLNHSLLPYLNFLAFFIVQNLLNLQQGLQSSLQEKN